MFRPFSFFMRQIIFTGPRKASVVYCKGFVFVFVKCDVCITIFILRWYCVYHGTWKINMKVFQYLIFLIECWGLLISDLKNSETERFRWIVGLNSGELDVGTGNASPLLPSPPLFSPPPLLPSPPLPLPSPPLPPLPLPSPPLPWLWSGPLFSSLQTIKTPIGVPERCASCVRHACVMRAS